MPGIVEALGLLIDPWLAISLGAGLMVLAVIAHFVFSPSLPADRAAMAPPIETPDSYRSRFFAFALLIIIAAGTILRLYGLEEKSLNHTEIFVPGISLPPFSRPPPRITFVETVEFHFHDEPHPPGYYFLMWGWTKVFGASVFSIRLPSVLFGVASIFLLFRIACRQFGPGAGILAAALLSVNGHHIYWSQMARMYSMACFLGLLSTFLLIRLTDSRNKAGRGLQAGYLIASTLGIWTEILYWPFLAAQMIWTLLAFAKGKQIQAMVFRLQVLVIMFGAPLWAHAIYRGREGVLGPLSLNFIQEFFTFGFLLRPDYFSTNPESFPYLLTLPVLAFSVACFLSGMRRRTDPPVGPESVTDPGFRTILPVMQGAVLVITGYSLLASRRQPQMLITVLVPLCALCVPGVLARISKWLDSSRMLGERMALIPISVILATVPPLIVFAVSFWFPLVESRLFLLFVPYMLILIAAGAVKLSVTRTRMVVFVILLAAVHVVSVIHFRGALATPVDYKGMASEIERRYESGDLVFVRSRSWLMSPIFYYLDSTEVNLIHIDYPKAARKNPGARIFVIEFRTLPPTNRMRIALQRYRTVEVIDRLRIRCKIYERKT